MFQEHELAVLVHDLPEDGLAAGDVGTVVGVYSDHLAYEAEFMTTNGTTVAVKTLEADSIRPRSASEITHVREVALPPDDDRRPPVTAQ
ncbi:hypothetical protein BST13_30565 [Mycobacterium aquaticum]|uniref:DUF4926 domain-containing protein n=1 Tax=Mycobacterium aquaticum TaxID=1927124 RepID=A0A1X0ABH4_9MYCO|nr:hypothetical protein BST13_30565 [Mycobacterium aquaticum]